MDWKERRPNDTILWARDYRPKLQGFAEIVFRLVEWTMVIAFVRYLADKVDSDLIDAIAWILWAVLFQYCLVLGWSVAPLVKFEEIGSRWKAFRFHAFSVVVALGVMIALQVTSAEVLKYAVAEIGD